MAISSFFSSFLPVVYADAPEEAPVKDDESKGVSTHEGEDDKEVEAGGAEQEEEEEEEEPEDLHPTLREECKETPKCAPLTTHFLHCQEKVEGGKGFKGEDCVEEFMMHCVDNCAAPKLFSKLK